jgi:alpha-beta hydrolase superfamily lysophospholipase
VKDKAYTIEGKNSNSLWFRMWKPDLAPHCVIALVHGFGEHSGRFEEWAHRFVYQGYAVCAFDLPGHGKSEGKRGYSGNYNNLLYEIDTFLAHIADVLPCVPVVLYGHGMGGNLVLNYTMRRRSWFNAVIASSPWLNVQIPFSRSKLWLAKQMRIVVPRYPINLNLNPSYISHNQSEVVKYTTDKLIHNRISLQLFFDIKEAGQKSIGQVYKIMVPLLVLHGTGDMISSYKSSAEFVRNTSSKVSISLWPDMYHDLHHEICNNEVFTTITKWIEKNMKTVGNT